MSCPSWSRLVAEREASEVDPLGWEEALVHLDLCPRCALEAPAVDPLLLFRRLPGPKVGPSDVEAMKAGVAAMIRASRVEAAPRRLQARWRRWPLPAAVAALVVAGLGLGAFQVSRFGHTPAPEGGEAVAALVVGAEPASLEGTIEDLSLVDARVYEVASEGLSVVTIIHPSLDW